MDRGGGSLAMEIVTKIIVAVAVVFIIVILIGMGVFIYRRFFRRTKLPLTPVYVETLGPAYYSIPESPATIDSVGEREDISEMDLEGQINQQPSRPRTQDL